jgi:hypothetical protein
LFEESNEIMKIHTKSLLIFIHLLFPIAALGQLKPISSENYRAIVDEAESRTRKQVRKRVQVQKRFADGKLSTVFTDTGEYLPPDKSRWTHTERNGDVVKSFEVITVGNIQYRKADDGVWTKREKSPQGIGFGGGKDNSSRQFFIEEKVIQKKRFKILTEKVVNFNNTYFDEIVTWINDSGLIHKSTHSTSRTEISDIVSSVEVTYDYRVKPYIVAPIP